MIDDPLIGLFLLICDLALNPTAGFPLQIAKYENFIIDVDAGIRFGRLSQAVGKYPHLRSAIVRYSRDEYIEVANTLADECGYGRPLEALEEIVRWGTSAPAVAQVMIERESFRYQLENLPIRLLLSHFVAFSQDKLKCPEFFCWAGAWMAGGRASEDGYKRFMSHISLFADKGDDDVVFPRNLPGKDPEGVKQTFNVFYANNIVYGLTRQWILQDGPFTYDLGWLSRTHTEDEMAKSAKGIFEHLYGANPDDFELL
jgi:hypothetical protein